MQHTHAAGFAFEDGRLAVARVLQERASHREIILMTQVLSNGIGVQSAALLFEKARHGRGLVLQPPRLDEVCNASRRVPVPRSTAKTGA